MKIWECEEDIEDLCADVALPGDPTWQVVKHGLVDKVIQSDCFISIHINYGQNLFNLS